MIEIQKNYADGSFLAMSQGNRVRDAVPKQRAIRQVGHRIVLRGVNHQFRHGPRGGDVVKDNHGTDDRAVTVVNGRGRIFYCGFIAVTPDEDAVASEAHRLVAADGQRHGVLRKFSRGAIKNVKDLGKRFSYGFRARPAGHGFSDDIEISDVAGYIRAEYGVPDGVEGNYSALPFEK